MSSGYSHSEAFDAGFLSVGSIHQLHYEQYGRKDGKPVVFLHGGPGGSTSRANTVFFNPNVYRVVLFDQRGSGKSLPAADLRENTSQHLAHDIEELREHLNIDRWHMVFGGSWGSTLALLYAQTYPEAVGSLVLRGIFTIRKSELDFTIGPVGAASLYPEQYEEFVNFLPAEERHNIFASYHKRLTADDKQVQLEASRAWNKWELGISQLLPDETAYDKLKDDTWCLQHARMEAHYQANGGFLQDGQLLMAENIDKIKNIPCSIVQGRYDIVCPPQTAWELHKALPSSKLYIIPDAGHSAMEPGNRRKLTEICDEYTRL